MSFNPKPGQYFRMPVFFGPTPGPREWPEGLTCDFDVTPKRIVAGVRFLSNRDQMQALLPDCFEVAGEPIVTVDVHYVKEIGWLAGRGYNMCDVRFDVIYKGKDGPLLGNLVLVRFENLCDPILSGREELGHNKLWCEIPELRIQDGRQSMELSWLNFPFLKMKLWDLQDDIAKPVANPDHKGMLSYKYIPATGDWGDADVAYATLTPPAPQGRTLARKKGKGSVEFADANWEDLPTLHHLVRAFRSLDQVENLGSFWLDQEGGHSAASTHRLY